MHAGKMHAPDRHTAGFWSADDFRAAVEMLPLISVDLLLRNADGAYLLGLRSNPPAQGTWFVPGGRILKDETMAAALVRIARSELALDLPVSAWTPRGIYEHFYDVNFAGERGRRTHYVVLAFETRLADPLYALPRTQHRDYRWISPAGAIRDAGVHPYTQAYFKEHAA
ncbi:GDP-mannose mannosyl hydrolase [Pigmentiphaga soli]|uniref:GDP-mannose mannosyl hydrolase n=2 Tax=Pigmentiphaga soli TaxID=1007095 RepID=A0ABP8GVL7_9BURK